MTQTNGLDILFAWGMFLVMLATLAYYLLRPTRHPMEEAERRTTDPYVGPEGRHSDEQPRKQS